MSLDKQSRVLEVLKTVNDPELHQDLVSLGMVGKVEAQDGRVRVVITLTTTVYPSKARIEEDVRSAVSRVLGVVDLTVEFESKLQVPQQEALPGVGYMIAVGSGKGGVGKSTMAANLAASLALEGASVGLLDADIYGPSQARMFSVEGKRLMADQEKRIIPLRNHGVKVISIANLVEDGQALTWRGPILHGTLTQMLKQTVWGDLDYLIVDLPPGTGDVQLSLSQLATVSGAVLVTTPQDVALMDVKRAYTMMRKTHIPVLGVVENMSYYALPDGSRDYIFGEGGAARFAEQEKLPLLGQVPITRALRESGDGGAPIVVADKDNPSALELRRVARAIVSRLSVQAMSSLPVL